MLQNWIEKLSISLKVKCFIPNVIRYRVLSLFDVENIHTAAMIVIKVIFSLYLFSGSYEELKEVASKHGSEFEEREIELKNVGKFSLNSLLILLSSLA